MDIVQRAKRLMLIAKWQEAWRIARVIHNSDPQNWVAFADLPQLIGIALSCRTLRDRHDTYWLTTRDRREQERIADEIIDEILREEQCRKNTAALI